MVYVSAAKGPSKEPRTGGVWNASEIVTCVHPAYERSISIRPITVYTGGQEGTIAAHGFARPESPYISVHLHLTGHPAL